MTTPADRVKRARELHGGYPTAKDAARAAGWNYETYKHIENGNRLVTADWAKKIASFYGVPSAWLLFGYPDPFETPSAELLDIMPDDKEAIANRIGELGLTYAKVSRELGKNHAYIQQYLKRDLPKKLPSDLRSRLADILQLPVERLVDMAGASEHHKTLKTVEDHLDDDAVDELLPSGRSAKKLDGEHDSSVIDYLRAVIETQNAIMSLLRSQNTRLSRIEKEIDLLKKRLPRD